MAFTICRHQRMGFGDMSNQGTAACYNCGTVVALGSTACPHCGAAFAPPTVEPTQPYSQPTPPPVEPTSPYPGQSADPYSHGPVAQAPPQPPYPGQGAYGAQPPAGAGQVPGYSQQATWGASPPPPEKGGKGKLVLILLLILILLGGGGAYYLLVAKKTPATTTTAARPTGTETPSPTVSTTGNPTASPTGNPAGTGSGTGNPTPIPGDLTAQHDIEAATQSERSYHDGAAVFTDDYALLISFDPSIIYGPFDAPRAVRIAVSSDLQTTCLGAQSPSGKRYWIAAYWTGSKYIPYYTTSSASVDHGPSCSAQMVHDWAPTKAGWM